MPDDPLAPPWTPTSFMNDPPSALSYLLEADNETQDTVNARHSLLPDKITTTKERYKYWLRRSVFYALIVGMVVSVVRYPYVIQDVSTWFWLIHALWFDLDVTVSKNNRPVRFFHGASFVGSFLMAGLGTYFIAYNTETFEHRSKKEHETFATLMVIHCIACFLPPLLHVIDLSLNRENLKKCHVMILKTRVPRHSSHPTFFNQIIRVLWMFSSPLLILLAWVGLNFQSDYKLVDANYLFVVPSLFFIDLSTTGLLVFAIRKKVFRVNSND